MKAIIIPSILAATVLVAGMFAFMPVQKASTVHTTITNAQLVIKTLPTATGLAVTDNNFIKITGTAGNEFQVLSVKIDGTPLTAGSFGIDVTRVNGAVVTPVTTLIGEGGIADNDIRALGGDLIQSATGTLVEYQIDNPGVTPAAGTIDVTVVILQQSGDTAPTITSAA